MTADRDGEVYGLIIVDLVAIIGRKPWTACKIIILAHTIMRDCLLFWHPKTLSFNVGLLKHLILVDFGPMPVLHIAIVRGNSCNGRSTFHDLRCNDPRRRTNVREEPLLELGHSTPEGSLTTRPRYAVNYL